VSAGAHSGAHLLWGSITSALCTGDVLEDAGKRLTERSGAHELGRLFPLGTTWLSGVALRPDDFSNHTGAKPRGASGAPSLLAEDATDSCTAKHPEVEESGPRAAAGQSGDTLSGRGEAKEADQRREGMSRPVKPPPASLEAV
jgi:hypothetical protein